MRLIDADAFKEYLKNVFEEVKHVYTDGGVFAWRITEDFCRDIDEQPTVNADPRWVPCSERLPDKPGSYICTCSDGTPYPNVTVIKFHPRTKAWELNGTRAYWKVRAWMPLPEPYGGNKE